VIQASSIDGWYIWGFSVSLPGLPPAAMLSPGAALECCSSPLISGLVVSRLRFLDRDMGGGDDGGVEAGSAGSEEVVSDGALSELAGRGLK
jgi:hypothetical protein